MNRIFFAIAAALFLIGLAAPQFKEMMGMESPTLYRKLQAIRWDEQRAQELRQLDNDNFALRCAWFGGAAVFLIAGVLKSPQSK